MPKALVVAVSSGIDGQVGACPEQRERAARARVGCWSAAFVDVGATHWCFGFIDDVGNVRAVCSNE